MRKIQIALICAACLFFLTSRLKAQEAKKTITNADVVEMVTAALSEQIIITSIRQAPAKDFDLTPAGLIALKKGGVPDTVVLVMQEVNAGVKSVSGSDDKIRRDEREPEPDDPNAKVKQELVLIERRISKASLAGDKATIDKFLADDFTLFSDGKSYTKAQYLKQVKPRKNIAMTDMENINLKLEGETAALTAIGVWYLKNGTIFRCKFTDKFVKSEGQWRAVASEVLKCEAAVAQPEQLLANNGCSGIENLGIHQNTAISAQIGGGVVEWLAKIRNNTAVTKIVIFGWRDMYGQQQKAQVQIRGGEIASVRLDLTQARVIPPVVDLHVLSCQ